jgi:hypothetical protein
MAAEKDLATVQSKVYAWSPTLRNSAIIRKYWKLRLRELDYNKDYQTTFDRILSETQRTDPKFHLPMLGETLSRETIRTHFTAASKEFRKCQRNSLDLRAQTYHDLMMSYEDDMNPPTRSESQRKLKIIRRTILAEATRRLYILEAL